MCAAIVVVFKNAVLQFKLAIRHTFVRVFERKNKEKQSILHIFQRKFCDETTKRKLNKTQLGGGGNNKRGKIGHYKKFCFNDFFYKIEELTKSRETHTLCG